MIQGIHLHSWTLIPTSSLKSLPSIHWKIVTIEHNHRQMGVSVLGGAMGYPTWMVCNGKSQSKMDDDWGYSHEFRNLQTCFAPHSHEPTAESRLDSKRVVPALSETVCSHLRWRRCQPARDLLVLRNQTWLAGKSTQWYMIFAVKPPSIWVFNGVGFHFW